MALPASPGARPSERSLSSRTVLLLVEEVRTALRSSSREGRPLKPKFWQPSPVRFALARAPDGFAWSLSSRPTLSFCASAKAPGGRSCPSLRETKRTPCALFFFSEPRIGRDHPLNLSISISGGKETNQDSLSNGERSGNSSSLKSPAPSVGELWPGEAAVVPGWRRRSRPGKARRRG